MSRRKCKILVVDWEPDALRNLHGMLSSEVAATLTWDEIVARKLVRSTQFDVILVGNKNRFKNRGVKGSPNESAISDLKQDALRAA